MGTDRADLSRLSSTSFEHLIRALAFKTFGASGTVFSEGPDGGRDFTLEGMIPGYESRAWDGYLVVQSKFRHRLTEQSDVEWLLEHIHREKAAFLDQESGRRRPDFYIVATNVHLSGSDGRSSRRTIRKSGYTRICEALETWKSDVGIKDYDIWPADKILDLLADAPRIRQSFAAWVTVGDVLSELLTALETTTPDFDDIIRRGLVNNLRRNQFTTLKDAGSVSDPKIRTSQVFIDVPFNFVVEPRVMPPASLPDIESNAVRQLVERSKERFDPDSVSAAKKNSNTKAHARNRIVLLGGPGQGKSTVSAFVAQLFRSALLERDELALSDETVATLIPEVLDRAEAEGISRGVPRRYPVFVSLPRYADSISEARKRKTVIPTLLSHVASDLSEGSDSSVDREDLRRWLGSYPWIVILDGLDEVPPSGERGAVLEAISTFMTEVAGSRADALIIVTTRPQGYNKDLDPSSWEHWELSELPPRRALAYAAALGEAWYPDDRIRRTDILKKLEKAASERATGRLMVSPLQVTILYLIVDTGGTAPTARWTLFNDYYEILRKREKAKGGKIQAVLEQNWGFIGPIHQRAGLILQAMSEVEGGAGSAFTKTKFEDIVRSYLASQGFCSDDLNTRVGELTDLALNRLVLLSAREEGAIRFDVRSLQEFMAAAALTSGETVEVEARLLHIAGIAHWRHVFLIAASRCFAEDAFHHRRTQIVAVTRSLEASSMDRAVANGARLALDMLRDGIGADHPTAQRVLARHAVELLSIGEFYGPGAARLWDGGVRDIMVGAIKPHLRQPKSLQGVAAWHFLTEILSFDSSVLPLVKDEFPKAPSDALRALSGLYRLPKERAARAWLKTLILSLPAGDALIFLQEREGRYYGGSDHIESWYERLFNAPDAGRREEVLARLLGPGGVMVSVLSVDNRAYFEHLQKAISKFKDTSDLLPILEFGYLPSAATLGAALSALTTDGELAHAKRLYAVMPWPLATLVEWAQAAEDLVDLASKAINGEFGDRAVWRAAETRWSRLGISADDVAASKSRLAPFRSDVDVLGAPSLISLRYSQVNNNSDQIRELSDLIPRLSVSQRRRELASVCSYLSLAYEGEVGSALDPIAFLSLYRDIDPLERDIVLFDFVWEAALSDSEAIILLSELAEGPLVRDSGETSKITPDDVLRQIIKHPSLRGLFHLLVMCASSIDEVREISLDGLDEELLISLPSDSWQVRISCLCLGVNERGDEAIVAKDLAKEFAEFARESSRQEFAELLEAIIDDQLFDLEYRTWFLDELLNLLDEESPETLRDVRSQLKSALDERKSGIREKSIWVDKLTLPLDTYMAVC